MAADLAPITDIRNFPGFASNVDPRDLPPGGAQIARNVQQLKPGVLSVRKGIQKEATYTDSSPTAYDLIAAFTAQRPEGDVVITEDSNGVIRSRKNGSASSIGSGYNTAKKFTFVKTRDEDVLGTNGIDRGIRWDGMRSAVEQLGITAPITTPTISSAPGTMDAEERLTYRTAYRWIDDTKPSPRVSSMSPLANITTVKEGDTFTHSAFEIPVEPRVYRVQIYRTLADDASVLYEIANMKATGDVVSITDATPISVEITSHGLASGARIIISDVTGTGSLPATVNATHTITKVDADNFTLDGTTATGGSYSSGGSFTLDGFVEGFTDGALADNDFVNVVNADGTVNAYGHTPPKNYHSVVVQFQDRAVYGVPVKYTTGTVSTTAGSRVVTGSGTNWTDEMDERYIYIVGENVPYRITSISSATQLNIDEEAENSLSGVSYAIKPPPDALNVLDISQADLPESVPLQNQIIIQENTPDHDEMKAILPFGSHLFVFMERHVYRVSWIRQPKFDASVNLADYRGALNQSVVASLDGFAYAMDQRGAYRINRSGSAEPIGEPIQNYWRDGILDLSDTEDWFATVDYEESSVRFWVSYATDSDALPRRFLEYRVNTGEWFEGQCLASGFGAGTLINKSGRARTLLAGEVDRLYLQSEGTTDGVSSQTRSTATAATSTTLTDSGASFGTSDELVGCPVGIVSGTGKGQVRRISSHTGTELTVDVAWGTTPSTDSVYLVGAIEWSWRSKLFEFIPAEEELDRSLGIRYLPTATAASLDVRRYMNTSQTVQANASVAYAPGTRITRAVDDPDTVLDLLDENNVPGYERIGLAGKVQMGPHSDRYVAWELRGFQGDDAIEVQGMDVMGVRG